jgi:LysM repeat protein
MTPGTPRPDGQKPDESGWRPIVSALVAIGVIVLTVSAAFLLTLQERPASLPPSSTPVQATPPPPTPVQVTLVPPRPLATPLVELSPTLIPTVIPSVPPTFTPVVVVPPTSTPPMGIVPPPTCLPRPGWVAYVVERGDTLNSLAARYGISVEELIEGNCLTRTNLRPGDIIAVPPVTPTPTATPTSPPPQCRPPANWVLYTVQPGDTLQSLAQRTNTSAQLLLEANCMRSDQIYVGQQIWLPFLPPPPTPTATYPLPATATYTPLPSPTFTPLPPPPTPTFTPVPPPLTPTFTPVPPPPTSTFTPVPPPPTPSHTPTPPPTNTPVEFIPPTATGG